MTIGTALAALIILTGYALAVALVLSLCAAAKDADRRMGFDA